ncbi:MAG: M23 family metallopeptidase [Gammaproteobacteria bacterium AqS3]|nr:M23 family metallopeptidase [Gammaproteobacteria bacterium AqS3]
MKIIFIRDGLTARSISSGQFRYIAIAAAVGVLLLGAAAGWAAYLVTSQTQEQQWLSLARQDLSTQRQKTAETLDSARLQLNSLYSRMARLNAQVKRFDAISNSLISRAGLPRDAEFTPAGATHHDASGIGGPGNILGEAYDEPGFARDLELMIQELAQRENRLRFLSAYLPDQLSDPLYVTDMSNWPIARGWLSSQYGRRIDPFHGRVSWHRGIDFAGMLGDKIHAVAAGVVSQVVREKGYGVMIEIDHGGGLKTRYAHCQRSLVRLSERIAKGQAIALMGSTGRSTGPHVHFEVIKNDRRVNPNPYIKGGRFK